MILFLNVGLCVGWWLGAHGLGSRVQGLWGLRFRVQSVRAYGFLGSVWTLNSYPLFLDVLLCLQPPKTIKHCICVVGVRGLQ